MAHCQNDVISIVGWSRISRKEFKRDDVIVWALVLKDDVIEKERRGENRCPAF